MTGYKSYNIGDVFIHSKRKERRVKKYKALKFNGDDLYSWAVFYTKDVKGYRSPIYCSMGITPIISGCTQSEARYYIKKLEMKDAEKAI